MKKYVVMILAITLLCSLDAADLSSKKTYPQLNNLVCELAAITLKNADNKIIFSTSRGGWVYFKLQDYNGCNNEFELRSAQNESQKIKFQNSEAMAKLAAGQYTAIFKSDKAEGRFIVRSIPELLYTFFVNSYFKSPNGTDFELSSKEKFNVDGIYLYYWDYLQKKILPSYNVVAGNFVDKEIPEQLKPWLDSGRKFIQLLPVLKDKLEDWNAAFKAPYDGVLADEFVPPSQLDISEDDKVKGGYFPGLGFEKQIFSVIEKLKEANPDKGAFYAYFGMPTSMKSVENCRPLFNVLEKTGYYWVWEIYMWEPFDNPEAEINQLMLSRMNSFRKFFPGSEKRCIISICTMDFWDSKAGIDMKVWLDMQLNTIANNASFDGLYGVNMYSSSYTKPEILEWFSMLLRHYFIEGQTSMLSDKYGYTLKLHYIDNPDFAYGISGWNIAAAAEKSIMAKSLGALSITQGYYPKSKNVLTMKLIPGKTNRISQKVKNLQTGQLYSISVFCGSPGVTDKTDYNISIDLKNAEIIRESKRILRGDRVGANNICYNNLDIVFKALGRDAELTISNGKPDNPAVKEIFLDGIQIQPFFQINKN